MSDPAKPLGDINDVLSSIRRLVAEQPQGRPEPANRPMAKAGNEPDALVLTSALRVSDGPEDHLDTQQGDDAAPADEGAAEGAAPEANGDLLDPGDDVSDTDALHQDRDLSSFAAQDDAAAEMPGPDAAETADRDAAEAFDPEHDGTGDLDAILDEITSERGETAPDEAAQDAAEGGLAQDAQPAMHDEHGTEHAELDGAELAEGAAFDEAEPGALDQEASQETTSLDGEAGTDAHGAGFVSETDPQEHAEIALADGEAAGEAHVEDTPETGATEADAAQIGTGEAHDPGQTGAQADDLGPHAWNDSSEDTSETNDDPALGMGDHFMSGEDVTSEFEPETGDTDWAETDTSRALLDVAALRSALEDGGEAPDEVATAPEDESVGDTPELGSGEEATDAGREDSGAFQPLFSARQDQIEALNAQSGEATHSSEDDGEEAVDTSGESTFAAPLEHSPDEAPDERDPDEAISDETLAHEGAEIAEHADSDDSALSDALAGNVALETGDDTDSDETLDADGDQPILGDAETSDAETSDAETSDAETSDAETSDAETSDAETSDAETSDAGKGDVTHAPQDPVEAVAAYTRAALETAVADTLQPAALGGASVAATAVAASGIPVSVANPSAAAQASTEIDLAAEEEDLLDEETLRRIVAEVVREELQGALGERITRNVRKLVRREIRLVLAADELD